MSNCFLSFSFCPIRGKETDISLIVDAIVASSCSTILIRFFKSLIRESEDDKVCVTASTNLCWLLRNFYRAWFCATAFSICQFKATSVDENCFRVPFGLVPTRVLIFQTCFVLACGAQNFLEGGKSYE